jgi:superfamily II DNA helicase RecQ
MMLPTVLRFRILIPFGISRTRPLKSDDGIQAGNISGQRRCVYRKPDSAILVMKAADRGTAHRQFMDPSRPLIMVATGASGMGIDKPNIRYIVHYQAPGSLEQSCRRLGAPDATGACILSFDATDLDIQERLQALSRPTVWHRERLQSALTAWATE